MDAKKTENEDAICLRKVPRVAPSPRPPALATPGSRGEGTTLDRVLYFYLHVYPPSTIMSLPVVYVLASDARYR
jgi:hypothetical protein